MAEDNKHGLINSESSGLIRRMERRLDLVNRLLNEIQTNALDRIDAELARRFLEDPDSVDLSKYKLLDDDAAHILASWGKDSSNYDVKVLNLNGLTNLSDTAAVALSNFIGDLYLNGLTCLSSAFVDAFDCRGIGSLYLDGLKTISDTQIKKLCCFWGAGVRSFNGLALLSEEAAEALSRHQGGLILNGLTSLSNRAADSLSKFQQGFLELNGLKSLSDAAAESLSRLPSWTVLYLNGLTSLSDTAAVSLSHHQGYLWLKNLINLSETAESALSKHQGLVR